MTLLTRLRHRIGFLVDRARFRWRYQMGRRP